MGFDWMGWDLILFDWSQFQRILSVRRLPDKGRKHQKSKSDKRNTIIKLKVREGSELLEKNWHILFVITHHPS